MAKPMGHRLSLLLMQEKVRRIRAWSKKSQGLKLQLALTLFGFINHKVEWELADIGMDSMSFMYSACNNPNMLQGVYPNRDPS